MNRIDIPGCGFIELMDSMGSDITVANAARISYWKEVKEFSDKEEKLIKFLIDHNHGSPLRHVQLQFRVECPEMLARQWFKHQVGMGYTTGDGFNDTPWNEISGRYVKLEPKFWKPTEFHKQSEKNKQASADALDSDKNELALVLYENAVNSAYATYNRLLNLGVAKEEARAVLPVGFITSFIMTTSLQGACHFIKLRNHEGAQRQIVDYAVAMEELVKSVCPITAGYLLDGY